MNAMFEQRKGEDFVKNNITPRNNADCIRAMSDEELLRFFQDIDACPVRECFKYGDDDDCEACIEKWLKSEVKE